MAQRSVIKTTGLKEKGRKNQAKKIRNINFHVGEAQHLIQIEYN